MLSQVNIMVDTIAGISGVCELAVSEGVPVLVRLEASAGDHCCITAREFQYPSICAVQ